MKILENKHVRGIGVTVLIIIVTTLAYRRFVNPKVPGWLQL